MYSKLSVATVLVGLGLAQGALADGPRTQVVFAPVVDVEPLVRQVRVTRPREECWLETQSVPRTSAGPAIAGGLLGGVIGHQIGHGHRNDAMTLLGTFVGSAIGADIAAKRALYSGNTRDVTTQRCEIVNESYDEERIDGYRVTYDYMGQRYATIMPEPPRGNRVRLHVTIRAAGY